MIFQLDKYDLLFLYPYLVNCITTIYFCLFLQLVLHLNEKLGFVIKECDETHILIDPAYVAYVKKEIEEAFEKNIWDSNASK